MKLVPLLLIAVTLLVSGCVEGDVLAKDLSKSENCGYYGQSCCEWFGQDDFGQYTARVYCYEGECRTGQCVEGADYGSAGRP